MPHFFFLLIATYFDLWLNEKLLDHRLFQEDRDYKMHKSNDNFNKFQVNVKTFSQIKKYFRNWQEQIQCRRECEHLL